MGCRVRQLDDVNSFQSFRSSQQQQPRLVSVITSTGSPSSPSSLLPQLPHQQRQRHRCQRYRVTSELLQAAIILLALTFDLLSTSAVAVAAPQNVGQPSYRQYIERQRAAPSPSSSGGPSALSRPNVVRYYKLHNRCSGQHLSIHGRHVDALAPFTSQHARLRIDSVWFGSRVRIQSDLSRNFMCFNKRGQLIVRRAGTTDYCEFREVHAANGFTEFRSVANESWSVGFGRNGRRLPGVYVDPDVQLYDEPVPLQQPGAQSLLLTTSFPTLSPTVGRRHHHSNRHRRSTSSHHHHQRHPHHHQQQQPGDDVRLRSEAVVVGDVLSNSAAGSDSAASYGVGLSAKAAARRRCYQFTKTDFPYIDDQQPRLHDPISGRTVNHAAAAAAEDDAALPIAQRESRDDVERRDGAKSTGPRHRHNHGNLAKEGSSARRQPPSLLSVGPEIDREPSAAPRIDYGEWFVRQVLNRKLKKNDDDTDATAGAVGCQPDATHAGCDVGGGGGSGHAKRHQQRTIAITSTSPPVRRRGRTTTTTSSAMYGG